MFDEIIHFIKDTYGHNHSIDLHSPVFIGNEKKYLNECIESTFVSSIGKFVDLFESEILKITGATNAIAVINGTMGLFAALKVLNVDQNCEVITQALTFVATANAIFSTGAQPIFVDVDSSTLGMSPSSLEEFLSKNVIVKNNTSFNKETGKKIAACVPMHTLGHPCQIDIIKEICNRYKIYLVEDAAESLGSYYNGKHTGTFGTIGIFSFNGNKVATTGGGGIIVTNDDDLAKKIKHVTKTAKLKHEWEFFHDELGYNFRMPNINAAIGLAQLENIPVFLKKKRYLAEKYRRFFYNLKVPFIVEPKNALSNYWLNAIILPDKKTRDDFLQYSYANGVRCRPLWELMFKLPMYEKCQKTNMDISNYLQERIVNLPSGVLF
ncbi:MAG: LegC family aminotransferase [Oligoflexia bacterium]|nr:LegC family aminotransferase [Oligoflexia bacterium]